MQPFNVAPVRFSDVNTAVCAYLHSVEGTVYYVGFCRLIEVMRAPDAHRNALWRELLLKRDDVEISVLNVFYGDGATIKAIHAARGYVAQFKPVCNMKAEIVPLSRRVRCITTGQTFNSAAEACSTFGIHQSNLSAYLKRATPGEKIKGLEFVRVEE